MSYVSEDLVEGISDLLSALCIWSALYYLCRGYTKSRYYLLPAGWDSIHFSKSSLISKSFDTLSWIRSFMAFRLSLEWDTVFLFDSIFNSVFFSCCLSWMIKLFYWLHLFEIVWFLFVVVEQAKSCPFFESAYFYLPILIMIRIWIVQQKLAFIFVTENVRNIRCLGTKVSMLCFIEEILEKLFIFWIIV